MINDLKDFEKFLKICRKHGANEVSACGVTVKLSELPKDTIEQSDEIPTDELSPEELMYYAVQNAGGQQ